MGSAPTDCPGCRRSHGPAVAWQLHQATRALWQRHQSAAEAGFAEAWRITPPPDRPRLQEWIHWIYSRAQGASGPSAVGGTAPANGAASVAASAAAGLAPPKRPSLPEPPSEGLYFTINEMPRRVVRVMDDIREQLKLTLRTRQAQKWWIALLFPAGLPFIYADSFLGVPPLSFSLAAYTLWGAGVLFGIIRWTDRSLHLGAKASGLGLGCLRALVLGLSLAASAFLIWALWESFPAIGLTAVALYWMVATLVMTRVARPSADPFGPKFELARALFETIADDLAPKRTLLGWLDLTGPGESKLRASSKNARGRKTEVYRDEWLRLKIPLYDGSTLRISALENLKKHHSYFKKGRSGKLKHQSGRVETRHALLVALTVDPQTLEVSDIGARTAGGFRLELREVREGRVVLKASSEREPTVQALLDVLKCTLKHTRRRQQAIA